MTYTEADRPDCIDDCGRKAALNKGELAYKGRCSGCYKADVARRREEKARGGAGSTGPGSGVRQQPGAVRLPAGGVGDGTGAGEGQAGEAGVGPGAAEPVPGAGGDGAERVGDVPADAGDAEPDDRPRGRRKVARSCGWCNDGNHVARPEAEPDWEDEFGNRRRGRPATWGCVVDQVHLEGPFKGESRGLGPCACHAAGHDRSRIQRQD